MWANLDFTSSRHDVGVAVVTTLLAAVTAWLAVTGHRHVGSVEGAVDYKNAVDNLRALDLWDDELVKRNVPRPLRGVPRERDEVVRKRALRECWHSLAVLALLAAHFVLFLYGVRVLLAAVGVFTPPKLSASDTPPEGPELVLRIILEVALPVVAGVGFAFGIGWVNMTRWTKYDVARTHTHLDVMPKIRLIGTIGLFILLALATGENAPNLLSKMLMAGPFAVIALPGVAVSGALRLSRWNPEKVWRRRSFRVWRLVGQQTRPLWELVELSLRAERSSAEATRDRRKAEAKSP